MERQSPANQSRKGIRIRYLMEPKYLVYMVNSHPIALCIDSIAVFVRDRHDKAGKWARDEDMVCPLPYSEGTVPRARPVARAIARRVSPAYER